MKARIARWLRRIAQRLYPLYDAGEPHRIRIELTGADEAEAKIAKLAVSVAELHRAVVCTTDAMVWPAVPSLTTPKRRRALATATKEKPAKGAKR